ncbi:MAG: sugar ABC transporter permease, partial [Anaerolineales bacterium]|nr:sugar ABC transporter permease [Anaerolineales bacterium]
KYACGFDWWDKSLYNCCYSLFSSLSQMTASGYLRRRRIKGLLFVIPVLVFIVGFNIYPLVYAFVVSFTQFDLFSPMKFVGFENYVKLAGNKKFWQALSVTVKYTLMFGPASWVLGFALAYLVREKILGRAAFRSSIFLPTILSAVAMATVWSLLLRINGPINAILGIRVPWLTSQSTALLGIAAVGIWQSTGWFMVVFLAGLQSVPITVYEAAQIDGANRWQALWHVTLPLLRPVLAFVVIHTIIAGAKVFTPMFIMTGGGPNNSTRSLAMMVYHEGFRDLRMGRATAISMISFTIILILAIVQLKLFRVGESD